MADDHGRAHGPAPCGHRAADGPARPRTREDPPPALAPAAAALRALAAPLPEPGTPLPGEEAALSAFRAARAATPLDGKGDEAGTVPPRRAGLRRPARAALVLVFAGCAASGVAVASGVVGLPAPFRTEARAPAAGEEPVAVSGRPGVTPGDPSPYRAPRRDDAPLPPPSAHPGGRRGAGPGRGTATPAAPAGGSPSASAAPDVPPGTREDEDRPSHDEVRGHRRWAARLCRDYLLKGKWREKADEGAVRTLEREAGGPAAVHDYCEHLLRDEEDRDDDDDRATEDEDGEDGEDGERASAPGPAPSVTFSGPPAL
ncbi:hypothetical protein I5Q34_16800 [Streptomyces sp. AV19]|uniref:hypothetical protein n=1 Tax=Streptomyces sp. AV19 TaxID=2793068 RepID=UPI0018FE8175|nr:hypothetical protein [Streptomyces sp. AV19]MBH1935908.1 hypothetical protein [Streptomyces sp. AV19]MDG4534309.1 hypothetical protein [Streptomyces sp. AV19]